MVIEKQIVKVEKIKIPLKFLKHPPKQEKINNYRNRFWHNKIDFCSDKPITVDEDYVLVDGYITYLILKEFYNFLDLDFEKQTLVVCRQLEDYRYESTVYVYGKHQGADKEYVWRMPKDVEYIPKVGEKIKVATSKGINFATVTKVETLPYCPYPGSVKLVKAWDIKDEVKKPEYNKNATLKIWENFRNTGLLWIVNTVLFMFGWGICFEYINEEVSAVYPCKTKHKFTEEENERGREKFLKYMDKEDAKSIQN